MTAALAAYAAAAQVVCSDDAEVSWWGAGQLAETRRQSFAFAVPFVRKE